MKLYAIKHMLTGRYIRIGRAKRYIWNQFPTNVIRHNIPPERRQEYVIEEFVLENMEPVKQYTVDKTLILASWISKM